MSRNFAGLNRGAPVFAALGDPQRLRIVARLAEDGPLSITRMQEGAPITRQAVTKHLRVLEAAGLTRGKRLGREKVWALEPRTLHVARKQLEAISQQWDDALERLRAFVEEGKPPSGIRPPRRPAVAGATPVRSGRR